MVKLARKGLYVGSKRSVKFSRGLALVGLPVLLAMGCGKFFPSAGSLVAISISPSNPTVQLNKTQQFTATGTLGDSSSKDISSSVTWTSSSTNVASINSSGLATAAGTGTSTITAAESGISGTTTLTVSTQSSGLTVTPATQTIRSGQTQQFSATQNGTNVSGVQWTSSQIVVAGIDQNGLATGLTPGTTTITATATVNGTSTQGTATLTVQ